MNIDLSLLEAIVGSLLSLKRTLRYFLPAAVVLFTVASAQAQDFCPGDLNRDGVVTTADAAPLLPLLFVDPLTLDVDTLLRADVNDDGSLTSADVLAILALDGLPCPTPLPTATATRTPTATPIVSLTATSTRPPTPTAPPACVVHQITLGSTNGTLSQADCQKLFSGQQRLADVYSIAAAPGTAIKIELTTAAFVGYLRVLDPAGQFETVDGVSPIQYTVTSNKPYQILVTSRPGSPVQTGDYTLKLTSTACPTPVAVALGTSRAFNLDGTECPEPSLPSIGTQQDPADVFTFSVTDVPTNISITMQQLSVNDDIFPVVALIGPDGFELVSQDSNFDCTPPTGSLFCTQIRFLALQRGTYTIYALGSGGTGRYSMALTKPKCTAKALTNIPSDHPLSCAGSGVGCAGTLEGSTTHTPCAAPLPDPGDIDGIPEPSSPADLYSFTANAGDVISVEMSSDDDPHLYLLGPSPINALVTADSDGGTARLAATLAVPGTYTVVAANNNALTSDDDPVNYVLLVQNCPFRGGLNLQTGREVSGTYNTLDCLGSQDLPYRSYAFTGQAGQFVMATMTSSGVDAFVRIVGPDGSVVENDDDLFEPVTTDARVGRILPVDGTYFAEASASPDGPLVDLGAQPAFTLRARVCSTSTAVPGELNGRWEDADCDLGAGRRADVYTFPAGVTPAVATVVPPGNGCVLALLGDGSQIPVDGCSTVPFDVPVLGSRVHGLIVAGAETSTRGAYTAGLSRCPLATLGLGGVRQGVVNGSNCADPNGVRADWVLIQGNAGVIQFNFGVSGEITAGFPLAAEITDLFGVSSTLPSFSEDPDSMIASGDNLAVVLRVTGTTAADQGAYSVAVEPALLRQ
jgi:Bacterial pre-peptidase C-terminal domain/Dockerin type I domain